MNIWHDEIFFLEFEKNFQMIFEKMKGNEFTSLSVGWVVDS
jgi:hypothetical protein